MYKSQILKRKALNLNLFALIIYELQSYIFLTSSCFLCSRLVPDLLKIYMLSRKCKRVQEMTLIFCYSDQLKSVRKKNHIFAQVYYYYDTWFSPNSDTWNLFICKENKIKFGLSYACKSCYQDTLEVWNTQQMQRTFKIKNDILFNQTVLLERRKQTLIMTSH